MYISGGKGNEVLQCITNLQTPEDKGFQEVDELSAQSLNAIKDFPVPVGWITAALPVSCISKEAAL